MLARRLGILRRKHGWFEVDDPTILDNVVSVGVADRLAAGALVDNMTGDGSGLQDGILPLGEPGGVPAGERSPRRARTSSRYTREASSCVLRHRWSPSGISGCSKLLNQLATRRKHASRGQFQT